MGMQRDLNRFRKLSPITTGDRERMAQEAAKMAQEAERNKVRAKKAAIKQLAHNHAEAFHLMRYRCKVGHDETVWNARDGVTPFIIACRTCNQEATHVEWNRDVYAPDHQPKPGDRIFVDLTEQRAWAEAKRIVSERWDKEPSPYRELFPDGTQEDATEKLVQSWLSQPGQPHLEEFRP